MKELPRKPRPARPRTLKRRVYTADALVAGVHVTLSPRRGAHERICNLEGDTIAEGRAERASMIANLGDRAIVCGPAVDDIAVVEVVAIVREDEARERYKALLVCGRLEPAMVVAHVMLAGKAKIARRARRAA